MRRIAWFSSALFAALLLALPAGAQAPAPTAAAAPPPTPIPFPDAVLKAANDLFSKANVKGDQVEFVIDPLIDGISGSQSTATRGMQKTIIDLVAKSYPRFKYQPFNSEVLARKPAIVVGTFTAVNNAGNAAEARDAYRICFTMADLASNSIVGKGVTRAKLDGVDVTPTTYYRDSPTWSKDPATEAYIKVCQGTKLGDAIDPVYAERLRASALINDGITEYESQHYRESLAFYRTAGQIQGGDQHRVRIGTYLANDKLGRKEDAVDAFGDLVEDGLKKKQVMVKLLFRPGTTQFIDNPKITGPYPMWLSQIATRAARENACLEIVGHTSRTGQPQVNERLSVLRAQYVMELLQAGAPEAKGRMIATGKGFKENLIGSGRDDGSDALDRRVEFKVIGC